MSLEGEVTGDADLEAGVGEVEYAAPNFRLHQQ